MSYDYLRLIMKSPWKVSLKRLLSDFKVYYFSVLDCDTSLIDDFINSLKEKDGKKYLACDTEGFGKVNYDPNGYGKLIQFTDILNVNNTILINCKSKPNFKNKIQITPQIQSILQNENIIKFWHSIDNLCHNQVNDHDIQKYIMERYNFPNKPSLGVVCYKFGIVNENQKEDIDCIKHYVKRIFRKLTYTPNPAQYINTEMYQYAALDTALIACAAIEIIFR